MNLHGHKKKSLLFIDWTARSKSVNAMSAWLNYDVTESTYRGRRSHQNSYSDSHINPTACRLSHLNMWCYTLEVLGGTYRVNPGTPWTSTTDAIEKSGVGYSCLISAVCQNAVHSKTWQVRKNKLLQKYTINCLLKKEEKKVRFKIVQLNLTKQ